MRVWAVGSLCFVDYEEFVTIFSEGVQALGIEKVTQLVAWNAKKGVGYNARVWATTHKVPFEELVLMKREDFRLSYGRRLQNWQTARRIDALIALWDGKSEHVATAILAAHREEIPIYVRTIRQPKILRGVRGRPRNEVRNADVK